MMQLVRRALPGETEVLGGVMAFFPTSLNIEPLPPVWVASAVIGQAASRLFSLCSSTHYCTKVQNVMYVTNACFVQSRIAPRYYQIMAQAMCPRPLETTLGWWV